MYRYELHMHTKEGSACAVSLVEDMIKQYVKIGFSGAVVTKDVPDHALMAGVPAKRIGWVCECGEVLKSGLTCKKCGRNYEIQDTGLVEK